MFNLIRKNWDCGFNHIFGENIDIFNAKTVLINHLRKPDAHASDISDSDFQSFRGAMDWLENIVDRY